MLALLQAAGGYAQPAPASSSSSSNAVWSPNLTLDGYIVPNENGYIPPVVSGDRGSFHLEWHYNYENRRTGSIWAGYDFSVGQDVAFQITPMIGAVFGRTNGIGLGGEVSIKYKKVQLSSTNEFVIDPRNVKSSSYVEWPTLTYSAFKSLRVGIVAQKTRAYTAPLDVQRGFLVGISHKKIQFTTYVFNVGWTAPTIVLEASAGF